MKFLSILSALMEMRDKVDDRESLVAGENRVSQAILVCLVSRETLVPQVLNLISSPSWNRSSSPKEEKRDLHRTPFRTCKLKSAL